MTAATKVSCANAAIGIADAPTSSETPSPCATAAIADVATAAPAPASRPVPNTRLAPARSDVSSRTGAAVKVVVTVMVRSLRWRRPSAGVSPQLRTRDAREDTRA